MSLISCAIFQLIHWAARKGLRDDSEDPDDSAAKRKHAARRTGIRGETYAYWYLRRHGYIFVARNYTPRGIKGELDLVGYDGETLAFVEVRTRTLREELTALPELSITTDKQRLVIRTAQRFIAERHINTDTCRFDVLAIDNQPGHSPEVRLHKDAFSAHL
jgi:putative endonuclease